jgi:hypothetical protein
MGKRRFDLFNERTRSENLPHRSGMDPDGPLLGEIRETPHSLEEFFTPVFIEEAPCEKIGGRDQEK